MWTHPEFRASAMSADRSAYGIVYPRLSVGGAARDESTPPERYLLELRGVAFRSALKPGTPIVTSGLGGVYPAGIPIGIVLDELETAEGWARTYLVRPAVRPPDVTNVMVLLPERTERSLETVWRSTESADSAARRIAAAGDSIARRLAADSARRAAAEAAQAAAADSARAPGASGASRGMPGVTAGSASTAPSARPPAARDSAAVPVSRPDPESSR
jgi:rod shape-determining protein MreC